MKVFEKIEEKNFMIFGFIFIVICTVFFIIFTKKDSNNKVIGVQETENSPDVVLAICPTYHFLIDNLEESGFEVIKTNSTSQSISLLREGKADLIISGRKPMPDEKDLKYRAVELEGHYSFLSATSNSIYENNLNRYQVYTDQEVSDIRKTFNLEENIVRVENVYEYLNEGIVITSWSNTDYSQSAVVHVLNSTGVRNPYSRMPFIYYNDRFEEYVDVIDTIILGNKLLGSNHGN